MRKITLLSFYVTLLFAAAASAFALDFSRFNHLVVFGDSLSDNGNLFAITEAEGINPPQPPFPLYGETSDGTGTFLGRFTDGRNWVDYFPSVPSVANHLPPNHFPTVTAFYSENNGTNVAIGGSTSADLLQSPGPISHGQIPDYIQAKGNRISSDDLYCIWIGANDFKAGIAPQQTAANILSGITALARAGAKEIILVDCPDISLTPEVRALDVLDPGTVQAAKQFVAAVNVLLAVEAPLIAWRQRLNVTFVDINAIFVPLVLNPAFFGFSNSTDPALLPTGLVEANPDSYVFWDGFHPTTKVHRIAAQFIYRVASSSFPFSILSSR
jgi:phospholipase/lecithinase/hemolysin